MGINGSTKGLFQTLYLEQKNRNITCRSNSTDDTYEDMEEFKLRFEVKVPGNCHRVLLDMKRNGYQKTSTQKNLFLRQLIPTIKLLRKGNDHNVKIN